MTTIWYLLAAGQHSRWHRVASDEVWAHHDGGPIELLHTRDMAGPIERIELAHAGSDADAVALIPAGAWQAARPLGAYTLVSCTVAPGFEFEDFALLADHREASAAFSRRFPGYADLI